MLEKLVENFDSAIAFKNAMAVAKRLEVGAIEKKDLADLAKRFDWGFDLTGLMPLITELSSTHGDSTLWKVLTDGTVINFLMKKAGVQAPTAPPSEGTLVQCPHCSEVALHKL